MVWCYKSFIVQQMTCSIVGKKPGINVNLLWLIEYQIKDLILSNHDQWLIA